MLRHFYATKFRFVNYGPVFLNPADEATNSLANVRWQQVSIPIRLPKIATTIDSADESVKPQSQDGLIFRVILDGNRSLLVDVHWPLVSMRSIPSCSLL